ncbi:MAG TPA: AAA family ATPase [Thermoguttaceae bacterium]|nr:AAA family ATPase [Thermoguttaceae bacterium]
MYPSHWNLRESPFPARLDPGAFFASPTHEEALARLHFLVEQHRCLGLLIGESGSGKSLLLEVFAQQLRREGRTAARISLLGLQPAEMLAQVAAALGCSSRVSSTIVAHWQSVTDRLSAYRYEQRDTVLLLDDADQADADVLTQVVRLVRLGTAPQSRLTVVLAGRPSRIGRWGEDLLELAELRVDVEPWDQTETEQYVAASLARSGAAANVFAKDAVARLQQLSHGVPRRVNQLADLALIVAAGEDLPRIGAEVVQSVYEELCPIESP